MSDTEDIDKRSYSDYQGLLPMTRSMRQATPFEWAGNDLPTVTLSLPDPTVGGQPGPHGILAWSTGYRARRMHAPFRGGVVTPPQTAVQDGGPVGLSTRTTRLKGKVEALYSGDMIESSRNVAEMFAR